MDNMYNRLEKLRKEKGITRVQMCRDVGISSGNVTDLKMGRRQSFSAKTLARIARYFNVPIAYLLGDMDADPIPYITDENGQNYLDLIEDGYVGAAFPTSKGTLTITSDDFDELANLWNTLKDRPEMKVLFKSATCATKEQIEAVAQMLDSFKAKDTQWED